MGEFDQHAESYSNDVNSAIGIPGLKHDVFIESKVRYLLELFKFYKIGPKSKVLDLGCGIGVFDSYIEDKCELYGCDISKDSISIAQKHNQKTKYSPIENGKLPFEPQSFDLIFTVNVMHHVFPRDRKLFLTGAYDALKANAPLCIFEHNLYNPLTRRVVDNCVFDKDAVLLTRGIAKDLLLENGFKPTKSKYILFFPFSFKWVISVESLFSKIPLGAQFYQVGERI